ncbi:pectinesterase family protein [Marinicrinis lubricantis]|uniref:Pectinesterase family protein n=1 Tax=Marinicrinis lubricantis TaxID=2086470 RepID=A0ABW1IVG5_9BACL
MAKKFNPLIWISLGAAVMVLLLTYVMVYFRFIDNDDKKFNPLIIKKAEAVGESWIKVTLNQQIASLDKVDLRVVSSSKRWDALHGRLDTEIPFAYTGLGMNENGQSEMYIEVDAQMDQNAKLLVNDHKGQLPLLTAQNYYNFDMNVDMIQADRLLTWQTAIGGWDHGIHKKADPKDGRKGLRERAWDGSESRSSVLTVDGEEVSSLNQGGTVNEMILIAKLYRETGDRRYKNSVAKAIDFLLEMQYPSGGWPQAFPLTGGESDLITIKDHAMIRALHVLWMIQQGEYPFDTDLLERDQKKRIDTAVSRGIAFLVDAQLPMDEGKSGWSFHYDPESGGPVQSEVAVDESIEIVKFLMSIPDPSAEVQASIHSAVEYFRGLKGMEKETRKKMERLVHVYDTTGYYDRHVFLVWSDETDTGSFMKVVPGKEELKERHDGNMERPHELAEEDHTISLTDVNADKVLIVARDGSGHYSTVQEAVDAVPVNNTEPVTIYIKEGLYFERIFIPESKPYITFIGESRLHTVITYLDITGTGFNGNTTTIEADDFTARNLTFANEAGAIGTASAVEVKGDRGIFDGVRIIGYQDTLYLNSRGGRFYFRNCTIEGAVDFIYGSAAAYFDQCILFSKRSGGYITAASTPQEQDYGLIFSNCTITGYPWVEHVYFGRPWREYANDVFLHTWIDEGKIHLAGWHNWGDSNKEQTSRYLEYGSYGPGANIRFREEWTRQISSEEAKQYTPEKVLRGHDGWAPYK